MLNVLVPVDGSPGAERAVRFVIDLCRRLAPVRVVVLNVQVPELLRPEPGVPAGDAEVRLRSQAEAATRHARTLLEAARVPYAIENRRGYIPQLIAQCAKEAGCAAIVMGTRGMGSTEQVLGSVARQVVNFAEVPVTLVK